MELLAPKLGGWSATIKIPRTLFNGRPSGGNITQSFTLLSNGTMHVSDDSGSSFSLSVPTSKFAGTSLVTLKANNTVAFQTRTITQGATTTANITLAISLYRRFCQPAGLRFDILGSAGWGDKSQGQIKMVFNRVPIKLSGTTAYFGNVSGIALGMDWGDSASLNPSYNSSDHSVSWTVGNKFKIDPVTVGTSTDQGATRTDYQGQTCIANQRTWLFYYDGASYGFRSSKDGITWSTETTWSSNGMKIQGNLAVFCSGNKVYYATEPPTGQYGICYRYGTLNADGTITWAHDEGAMFSTTNKVYAFGVSTTVSSTGVWWIAGATRNSSNMFHIEVWKCALGSYDCYTLGWTKSLDIGTRTTGYLAVKLTPLTGGKISLVYAMDGGSNYWAFNMWDGSAWQGEHSTSSSGYLQTGSCVAILDTTDCVLGTGAQFYSIPFTATSWPSHTNLGSEDYETLSTDGGSLLAESFTNVTYSTVGYRLSNDGGMTWGSPVKFSTSESYPYYITATSQIVGGIMAVAWEDSYPSPYNVRIMSIPVIPPTAATSTGSWSKPGLSPYESYFSNLNEYVSPGNGLLSVGIGTASIPSRGGLAMQAGLVYSMPYAFRGSSVFQYDNSTLGNAGAGWSFNLPWLGTNYVHLIDGEAIPYAWSGTSFVFHGPVDFNLTKGTSGCPCTLTMKDGTTYSFNSTKRLTTQTDRTGNNTITFTWGTYGIKQIGDSRLSSAIQITYDTSHRISTISESGATWTLAYSTTSPSQLTSVTDQLSRVTTFQYAGTTGANLWLLNAVLYPTGGKTTYTFGSGAVGTEVTTEYVTARNVYSATSPLTLSRTDSISYRVINGQVSWANTTYSNGVNIQGYLRMNFVSPIAGKPYELRYDINSSGSVIRTIAQYFDSKGRLNQTQSLDPYAGYWPINEGAGTKTVDVSGNGENGTLGCVGTGCTNPSWASGLFGGALTFNPASSTGSYVSIANSKPLQLAGSFTWSFWFKPGTSMIGRTGYLLDKHAAVAQEYLCYYGQDSGHANQVRCTVYLGGVGYTVYSTTTFSTSNVGKWTLVDFAFDSGAHKMYLYVNGTQQATTTTSSSALTLNTAQVLLGTGEATGGNPASTFPFFGTLDEVRAYTIALSSSQVSSIYSTSVLPGMAVLASSMSAYDSWGNLKYSKDNVGHEIWSSFANTDSQGSLGSSGCATSGFYTQTVKSGIHDLLIGRCDYQNGSGSAVQESFDKYDRSGDLLTNKVLHNLGWLKANFTYDLYGNHLTATDFNGHTTYFRYSSTYSGAFLTKRSILVGTQNVTTNYTYDSAKGFMLSETDPNGQTTSYQYDALGRVTQTTYPAVGGVNAIQKTYYYDGNDTMKLVDPNGHVTKEYFDGLARQTKVERWNGSSVYSTETYTYNWLNAVATKTTATSHTYSYSYDWNGRLTKLTNPDMNYSTTTYNDVKNLKTIADERGHNNVYAYDWNQRLTSVNEYNGTASHYTTIYSYDLSGNQVSAKDGKNQTTSYLYDDLNRLNTTTYPTSPSTKDERSYDSVGNLLTRITANSSKILYTYDNVNRLKTVTYPGSGGTVTYTYDPASNRLTMVNPSASDYYTYDTRNRVTNSTEYVGGTKYQTLYSYDKASNMVQTTYPDGYALSMSYDAVNRLKVVGPSATPFATVGYTVDDKVSKINYGNGEVATYTYDTRDRPTRILDKYGSTKEMDLNYTYDGTGNVLKLNTENYRYDWLNRLNYSSGPWTTITYAYDQVGNRVKMVQGTTTTYTYGAFNRLSSAGSTTYTYDANGNTKTKTGGWTFSYDYENRLTKAVQSGTTVQQNTYDGNGNRVKQVAGTNTFTYSYQGLSILYEKNITGGTTTVTKHFYAGGVQVAKMVGSTIYYLHQDALGSTRLVATSTVTIKFSSNYVPYGNNYAVSGKEVFMYTGKPSDSATGLYYYGARYYDPTTGRFITQDSYKGNKNDPVTLNLYIYARDNPERYVDPTGHFILVSVTTVEGMEPRPWAVLPLAPTLTDLHKVTYGSAPPPTAGTSAKPVDVTLTQQGLNQYANAPTIGASSVWSQGAPLPSLSSSPHPGETIVLGAIVMAVGATEIVEGLAIVAAAAWFPPAEVIAVPMAIILVVSGLVTMPIGAYYFAQGVIEAQDCGCLDW